MGLSAVGASASAVCFTSATPTLMSRVMSVREEGEPEPEHRGAAADAAADAASLDALCAIRHSMEAGAADRAAWRQQVTEQLSSHGEQLTLLVQQQQQIMKAMEALMGRVGAL